MSQLTRDQIITHGKDIALYLSKTYNMRYQLVDVEVSFKSSDIVDKYVYEKYVDDDHKVIFHICFTVWATNNYDGLYSSKYPFHLDYSLCKYVPGCATAIVVKENNVNYSNISTDNIDEMMNELNTFLNIYDNNH